MKVTCTGRRVTLKPSFIENAEKRLAKLDKFFPDEAQAQVTVTVEKSGQTVEIMLRSKDLAMRAEKTDERMEDALADAVDLLTRRVVKYRKRLGTKLTAAAAEIPATEPEESMDIVREKHFALRKPFCRWTCWGTASSCITAPRTTRSRSFTAALMAGTAC